MLRRMSTPDSNVRVAMAQGKHGIWLPICPDRENTGNLGTSQGKF